MTTPSRDPGYRSIGNRPTIGNRLTRQVTAVTEVTDISRGSGRRKTADNGRAHEVAALLAQLAELLGQGAAPDPEPEAVRLPPRTLLTVQEAADQLGIGKTKAYSLVTSGELGSIQIGRLRRVPIEEIQNYAARLMSGQRPNRATA
jgi:excisionase family DNA binding protein